MSTILEPNIVLMSDSYKYSHHLQFPKDTRECYYYFESRGGPWDLVFFGLQAYAKKYITGQVVTAEKIDEAEELINAHIRPGIFNRKGWEYILDEHKGRLPVKIMAVKEGTRIPSNNVVFTVENTDQKCFWLPGHLETSIVRLWYPSTIAAQSYEFFKLYKEYMNASGEYGPDAERSLRFKVHDFGYRGVSSEETAEWGGAAHLLSFMGTDTIAAIRFLQKYYNAKMPGYSIPASEHSTMTTWGKNNEADAMRNMITTWPTGVIACVSDSYDIIAACEKIWGTELHDEVMKRDGTLVIRPDSGEPVEIVLKVLEILGNKFGYTVNQAGFKKLDKHVRVIQGDGINLKTAREILDAMKHNKWSADNLTMGSGGGLLQNVTRDTLKFAYKCCAANVNGQWKDVFKSPITAEFKRSKAGRMKLIKVNGALKTVGITKYGTNLLEPVVIDGELIREQDLDSIRQILGTRLEDEV